jgi:hypothetical protein
MLYFIAVFFYKETGPLESGPFLPDLLQPDLSYPGPFVAEPFVAGPFAAGPFKGGTFCRCILYSTLLHLPPRRLHCVGGCWY